MEFKNAQTDDFDIAFEFIKKLWSYNTYDRIQIQEVYNKVIKNPDSFFFFLLEDGKYKGMCHGDYFDTFWMSGQTCYISSLYVSDDERCKGYGTKLLNHAKELAKLRSCNALILDSGLPRLSAHKFYENYGFEKSCYGFEMILD